MLLTPERTHAVPVHGAENGMPSPRSCHEDSLDTRQVIRRYILENFLFSDDQSALADDASFLQLGIIDSMGALEVAMFLEQRFGFAVRENEMLPENLDSVNNLVRFIETRQKGA